jgi:hypothetical protein
MALVAACAAMASVGCGGAVSPTLTGTDGGPDGAQGGDSAIAVDSSAADSSAVDSSTPRDAGPGDTSVQDTGQARDTSIGADSGRVPTNHRPDDSECLQPAPPGDCNAGGGGPSGECSQDDQCTMGTMGRCINDGPLPGCRCTYDSCAGDGACGAGEVCACHGSSYTQGAGNTCVPGNCRVDSDCGSHGYCSPTTSSTTCGSVTGYYCHTPDDQCVDDSDCGGAGFDICGWSTTDSRWECQMGGVCA